MDAYSVLVLEAIDSDGVIGCDDSIKVIGSDRVGGALTSARGRIVGSRAVKETPANSAPPCGRS